MPSRGTFTTSSLAVTGWDCRLMRGGSSRRSCVESLGAPTDRLCPVLASRVTPSRDTSGWPLSLTELRQQRLGLGEPEGHLHGAIHLNGRRQRGAGLLPLAAP